jgi:hypothetical protein
MKYLKKWNLYFEDLKIEDSDTSDIKKAKEKLNTLRTQISEFNSKYREIDVAYKSNDDKKILDMEKKLFGNSDIKNGPDRNEFLVKYLNIAKKKREIDKGVNQIATDNLNLQKSQDILSITTDSGIKDQYNKQIPKIKQKIQNTKNSIEKKKVDISNSFQNIQKEMLEREKEMIDYISKIEKDSNNKY